MHWIKVRLDNGQIIGNLIESDEAPKTSKAHQAVMVALGYPETCQWNAEKQAFQDTPGPVDLIAEWSTPEALLKLQLGRATGDEIIALNAAFDWLEANPQ